MSQRNPKLIDLDFAPPASGPQAEDGGGSDIRGLMNQLQQTAFELRHRLSAVEDERNQLASKVETLQGGKVKPAESAPVSEAEGMRQLNLDLSRMAEGLRRSLTESEQKVDTLQNQLATLRAARDAAQDRARELSQKLEQAEFDLADLRDAAEYAAASAPVVLAPAAAAEEPGKIEMLLAEKNAQAERAAAAEREVVALRQRCEALERLHEEALPPGNPLELEMLREENREVNARLEAQRLETIDLATRFQATQEQMKSVSASLAEARLMAKAATTRATPVIAVTAPVMEPEPPPVLTPLPAPAAASAGATGVFSVPHAQSAVRELRRCYQSYAKDPQDLSHLNELHCVVHSLSEQAGASGLPAIQRLAGALGVLVQELYQFPEQINKSVLTTVVDGIEFLSAVLKLRDLRQLRDPAETTACIVDDDAATAECIMMAMESVYMQAGSFREPAKALCELSSADCDLIVLDVQMPGMDGFELCQHIRGVEHHKNTPILFVTGQPDAEVRARAILSGGNDFMTKPFMLCEVGLKGLLLSMKAQLHMV